MGRGHADAGDRFTDQVDARHAGLPLRHRLVRLESRQHVIELNLQPVGNRIFPVGRRSRRCNHSRDLQRARHRQAVTDSKG